MRKGVTLPLWPILMNFLYWIVLLCRYISCNPESLLANAVELCMPLKEGPPEKVKARGGFRGTTNLGHARRRVKNLPASEPFRPVKSTAVDHFPHTKHCEMVMLFER
jgi:tRNA (uracil-5-)-methyltransferase